MQKNPIICKSYSFAVRIVRLAQYLQKDKSEFILSKQILRSGTSIGVNIKEAVGAQSQKDFFSKLTIAYKEALETEYWLSLLRDTNYLEANLSKSLILDCNEILKILGSIKATIRRKHKREFTR